MVELRMDELVANVNNANATILSSPTNVLRQFVVDSKHYARIYNPDGMFDMAFNHFMSALEEAVILTYDKSYDVRRSEEKDITRSIAERQINRLQTRVDRRVSS